MPDDELRELVARSASRHCIAPDLIAAIVQVESGGNPWAIRYEPDWPYFLEWHKNAGVVSPDTERAQQATSWGLMQVMGTVARELGFDGPFLSALCDPYTGLDIGCRKLAHLLSRYNNEVDAVAAYNAGSARRNSNGVLVNQWYVAKVYREMGRKIV